jgi:acyl carrier protein
VVLSEEFMANIESSNVDDIERDIRNLIADIIEVPPEHIHGDTSFGVDLGVDSLMALEIIAGIEKKYRIQIPEERLQKVKTLNDTVALAREYLSGLQG